MRHAKSMRDHDDGILSLRAEGVELAREPVLVHTEAGTGSAPPHVHLAFPVCAGMFLLCLLRLACAWLCEQHGLRSLGPQHLSQTFLYH